MAVTKFTDTGVIGRIRRIADETPRNMATAVEAFMYEELPEVVAATPFLSGNLRSTEHVEKAVINGKLVSCDIVAGGPDAPYALVVHERLDVYHPIGGAKYIERVLNQSAPHAASRLASKLQLR
jgi:hypothetical protein